MNTNIRIEIDGEIDYNALKPLLKQLEMMANFDFTIKVSRIKITNPSYDFFSKPFREIGDKGEFDDNNYFGPIESKKEEIER